MGTVNLPTHTTMDLSSITIATTTPICFFFVLSFCFCLLFFWHSILTLCTWTKDTEDEDEDDDHNEDDEETRSLSVSLIQDLSFLCFVLDTFFYIYMNLFCLFSVFFLCCVQDVQFFSSDTHRNEKTGCFSSPLWPFWYLQCNTPAQHHHHSCSICILKIKSSVFAFKLIARSIKSMTFYLFLYIYWTVWHVVQVWVCSAFCNSWDFR